MRTDISEFLRGSEVHKHLVGSLQKEDSPLKVDGLSLMDPIEYEMDIYKVDRDLEVDVEVRYTLDQRCDRCLQPARREIRSESHVVVTANVTEEDEFPLEELVFSQVITSVPTKILCKDDCKGLCPVCGVDLNKHPDHEHEQPEINPFESLKNLFEK